MCKRLGTDGLSREMSSVYATVYESCFMVQFVPCLLTPEPTEDSRNTTGWNNTSQMTCQELWAKASFILTYKRILFSLWVLAVCYIYWCLQIIHLFFHFVLFHYAIYMVLWNIQNCTKGFQMVAESNVYCSRESAGWELHSLWCQSYTCCIHSWGPRGKWKRTQPWPDSL